MINVHTAGLFNRGSLEWVILCIFVVVIQLNDTFNIGFGRHTLSFYMGLILIFSVFTKPRFYLLPFSLCLVMFFPLFMNFLSGEFFGLRGFVFLFNLTIFYCVCVCFIEMSLERSVLVLMVFALSGLCFSFWDFFWFDVGQTRFSGGGLNPNDIASLSLVIFALLYHVFVIALDNGFFGIKLKLIKYFLPFFICVSIYLMSITGTRFALLGCVLLSFFAVFHLAFFARSRNSRRSLLLMSVMSLFLSLFFVLGIGGSDITRERLSFSYNADGNVNKTFERLIFDESKNSVINDTKDLGKVDGSVSSFGGRLPAWRLSYYMADDLRKVLFGVGWDEFHTVIMELQIPTPHNYFVESFIQAGVLGVLPLLAVVSLFTYGMAVRLFNGHFDSRFLLFGVVLLIMFFMNIWYLKPFWLLLAILVSCCNHDFLRILKGNSVENSISN